MTSRNTVSKNSNSIFWFSGFFVVANSTVEIPLFFLNHKNLVFEIIQQYYQDSWVDDNMDEEGQFVDYADELSGYSVVVSFATR